MFRFFQTPSVLSETAAVFEMDSKQLMAHALCFNAVAPSAAE
jgi:hypothetical protein